MTTELIKSIKAREYGDIRSILDEHYWPASTGKVRSIKQELSVLEPAVTFSYSWSAGWWYEEEEA